MQLEKPVLPMHHLSHASRSSRPTVSILLLLVIAACIVILRQAPTDVVSQASPSHRKEDLKGARLRATDEARRLDRHYASHLNLQHSGGRQSSYADNANITSKYSSTIVLGRMSGDKDRVQWVYDKLVDVRDPQVYVVDDPETVGPHLKKNHGREAAVYLSYIIEHYDDLHDITFFWHNDEKVWHNNLLLSWNSVETINRMDRENIMRSGYVPSRCDHWPGCPAWIKFNPSKAEHTLDPHRLEEMFMPELFTRLFPGTTEFPPFFAGTCCSQFAVSRDTIRSRPLETYKAIIDWILEYQFDDRSGMVMEYVWPYLFSERGAMCPSMESCYCKTYNICVDDEDAEHLTHWNDLRTRREEVKWQLTFYEEAMESAQRRKEEADAPEEEIINVEDRFQPEIDKFSAELDRLADKTWSAREQIIKHWRLPPPPTGW